MTEKRVKDVEDWRIDHRGALVALVKRLRKAQVFNEAVDMAAKAFAATIEMAVSGERPRGAQAPATCTCRDNFGNPEPIECPVHGRRGESSLPEGHRNVVELRNASGQRIRIEILPSDAVPVRPSGDQP